MLNNVGFESWFTAEHVFPEEDEDYSATLKAVRYAHNKLAELKLKAPFTAAPELTAAHRPVLPGQLAAATLARSVIEATTPPSLRMSVPVR